MGFFVNISAIPIQVLLKTPYHGVWYSFGVNLVYYSLHVLSYFLYRIAAYYCNWSRGEKRMLQIFQELVQLMVLSFLYMEGGNYYVMFECPLNHIILEYIFPFFIVLFFIGYCCEVSFFKMRLIDIKKWEWKTWCGFLFIVAVLLFLVFYTFVTDPMKAYFFLGTIPCLVFFIAGYFISIFSKNPKLRFHPRSYQVILTLCLLRKTNSFYCRLFAGICTAAFVRCVAANPLSPLLEPIIVEEVEATEQLEILLPMSVPPTTLTSSLMEGDMNGIDASRDHVAVLIPVNERINIEEENRSLSCEDDENRYLETIELFNRGETVLPVTLMTNRAVIPSFLNSSIASRNEAVLMDDSTDPFLYSSRASDFADWNDQQKKDLLGDYENL